MSWPSTEVFGGSFVIQTQGAPGPFELSFGGTFEVEAPGPPVPDCFLAWDGGRVASRHRVTTDEGRYP